jgi:dienelactone hydrolase
MTRYWFCCLLLTSALASAQPLSPTKPDKAAAAKLPKLGEWGNISFAESPPQADADQIKFRMSAAEQPPIYYVKQESYSILVPKGYKKEVPYGLFIWISAGATASIPKEWEKVLADKKLIFIGALNSGNPRNVFDRMRLAIDANHNLRGLYNVDGRRVYVSGFSGGSRVASMLGVCYADMFSGAACFMGTNFYQDLLAEDKMVYETRYIPNDEILDIAKQACRYSLITGEKDFNLADTKAVHAAMQKEGFKNALLFNIPAQGHQPPAADWLSKALDFLDEGKPDMKAKPGGLLPPR